MDNVSYSVMPEASTSLFSMAALFGLTLVRRRGRA